MMRLIVGLFLLLLGSGGAFAQTAPPTGCTTTTCTGAALPSGYLSVVGNQLQNSPGNNVRPACTVFRGLPTDSMAPIRNAGFNCVEIGWRDAYLAGGTSVATTFSDEFTSAPWDTHSTWQSGDAWGYGTSWAQAGLSEGPSWWGNAVVTPTAGTSGGGGGGTNPALVSQSGSMLNLALIANPGGLSGVGTCNGGTCGTIGALIQNQQVPGGNQQLYGYFEFSAAVQAAPGFLFHWDEEDYPINSSWTVEMDVDIWTNSDGSEHVSFTDPIHANTIYSTTAIDITKQNVYGVNWQSDFLTFYINGVQVAQAPNPGGDYQSQPGFAYFLTSDASYLGGTGHDPATLSALPAVASIDYYHVYPNKPTAATVPPGCNSLSQIAACVTSAQNAGLSVILSHLGNEVPAAGSACVGRQQNGLWFDSGGSSGNDDGCGDGHNWTYADFKANTVSLLKQFANNQTVIGYEFHNEPLVNGSFTGTGGGGGGTGAFSVSGGRIHAPDGSIFVPQGLNVLDDNMASTPPSLLLSLFPKLNFVRLAVGGDDCGYPCAQSNAAIESFVNAATALNIVVAIESHFTGQPAASSIDLPGEAAWYKALATDLKDNHFAWFMSGNELGSSGLTAEHQNVYDAVRGAGKTDPILLTSADGGPFSLGFTPDGPASAYTSMHNIVWDQHFYNWEWCDSACNNNTATNAQAQSAAASYITSAQSYTTSADGTIPAGFYETGYNDYVCTSNGDGGSCGTMQNVPGAFLGGNNSAGAAAWLAYFTPCCHTQTDHIDETNNTRTVFGDNTEPFITAGVASGGGGGGGSGNPPVNWGGGGDTDIRAACSDVGAAVNAVNAGVIEFCPGPLNNTATLLNGTARP